MKLKQGVMKMIESMFMSAMSLLLGIMLGDYFKGGENE